jgi:hypothetical protein
MDDDNNKNNSNNHGNIDQSKLCIGRERFSTRTTLSAVNNTNHRSQPNYYDTADVPTIRSTFLSSDRGQPISPLPITLLNSLCLGPNYLLRHDDNESICHHDGSSRVMFEEPKNGGSSPGMLEPGHDKRDSTVPSRRSVQQHQSDRRIRLSSILSEALRITEDIAGDVHPGWPETYPQNRWCFSNASSHDDTKKDKQ